MTSKAGTVLAMSPTVKIEWDSHSRSGKRIFDSPYFLAAPGHGRIPGTYCSDYKEAMWLFCDRITQGLAFPEEIIVRAPWRLVKRQRWAHYWSRNY